MSYGSGGIHHVTAIARDPRRNVAFYTGVLGLRLVKRTVNFNDPGTWHLYYAAGDGGGAPGTILSFLAYPSARDGWHGTGQAVNVALAIPRGSLCWWMQRLAEHGVAFELPFERFGERVLRFEDHDGLALELVTEEGAEARPAVRGAGAGGGVPAEHGLRGLAGMTLWQRDGAPTAALLVAEFGFVVVGHEHGRLRVRARGAGGPGGAIDLWQRPTVGDGGLGAGTVHSVTLRVPGDAAQAALRRRLVKLGYDVSAVFDLRYFQSVYFREPGGAVLGLATDAPGFAVDEPADALGRRLMLPPWLEWRRPAIMAALPPLRRDPPAPRRSAAVTPEPERAGAGV